MSESISVLKRDRAQRVEELSLAMEALKVSSALENTSILAERAESAFNAYERAHLLLTTRMTEEQLCTEALQTEHGKITSGMSKIKASTEQQGVESPRLSEADRLEQEVAELRRNREEEEERLQQLRHDIQASRQQHERERQRFSEERASYGRRRHDSDSSEGVEAMTTLLKQLVISSNLPKPTLVDFDGNPTEFSKFMNSFNVNIESCIPDPRLRLNYLIQFCKGEAREAIEPFVLINPEEGYQLAKQTLKDRFGLPHVVARFYMDRLVKGSNIRSNDTKALELLASELQTCELTLKSLKYEDTLNNLDNLRSIVARLPYALRSKWTERAASILEDTCHEARFSDLLKFIQKQIRISATAFGSDLANDARSAKSSSSFKPHKSQSPPVSKGRNFQTHEKHVCRMCAKNCSSLSKCLKFKDASLPERKDFIIKNKLCFLCFEPDHMASSCKANITCSVCNKKHNMLMHRFSISHSKVNVNCHKVSQKSDQARVCLPIIPVSVKGAHNQWVDTYALLDTGSDISLCSQRLLHSLRFKGVKKSFSLTTVNNVSHIKQGREVYLRVRPFGTEAKPTIIDKVWSVADIPVSMSGLASPEEIQSWPHLKGVSIPKIPGGKVEILLGVDQGHVLTALDTRVGGPGKPNAAKGVLGWYVFGPCYKKGINPKVMHTTGSVRFQQKGDPLLASLDRMWSTEFSEVFDKNEGLGMSREDKRAQDIMDQSIIFQEGHYHVKLPWREDKVALPNNFSLAQSRLKSLKNKLSKDQNMLTAYSETINKWIQLGQAREVTEQEQEAPSTGKEWYLPHFEVVNPHKPEKIRVVYDCASVFQGKSLNMSLLQGPLIMNSLLGVLLRFRQEQVAIVGDIESMFHQVKVYKEDEKSLRFLWYPEGDISKKPKVFCMCVHLFGATSSPSCASYALRKAATDQSDLYSPQTVDTVIKNFYVDDCLKSVEDSDAAVNLVSNLSKMLGSKGFRITKWISNDRSVLSSVPEQDRAPSVKQVSLEEHKLPVDRTLGISWDVQSDSFQYNVSLPIKPKTRRGILSCIASFYDPIGFCSPTTLEAKMLLQGLCKLKLGWDDEIPAEFKVRWDKCVTELNKLQGLKVSRCFTPAEFGTPVRRELHCFADASSLGYGCCLYLRSVNVRGEATCSLVMGKSRLAPLKVQTIPRLELSAAVVACRVSQLVQTELELEIDQVYYWSDSMIVLSYINNQSSRFKTYVANRISIIHELSSPKQWRYVPGSVNPADLASRGISACDKQGLKVWTQGPSFLLEPAENWPSSSQVTNVQVSSDDIEIKGQVHTIMNSGSSFLHTVVDKFSSFHKMCRIVSWLIRFKQYCRNKFLNHDVQVAKGEITVTEVSQAERSILKLVQSEAYSQEVSSLSQGKCVNKSSALSSLAPFLKDGIMLLGGRLQASQLDYESKHQIILPPKHNVTNSLILDAHLRLGHMASHSVLYELREKYWIVHGLSAVKHVLNKCVTCKKLRAKPCQQQMSDLPEDRVKAEDPPFSSTGLDFFGNFYVKIGRKQFKRYGLVFTCLAIRAVHIEVTESLSTESFLLAFTRFCNIRGCPKRVFSDNGTSIVRGSKELKSMLMKLDQTKINNQLVKSGIEWHFGVPTASHQNGVFERVIRSIRSVLAGLVGQQVMTPETLATVFSSCMFILNSRPITPLSSDPNDFRALSPNSLLLFKYNASFPLQSPSGQSYPVRRWAQIEYLTQLFWKRWSKEFLSNLQSRQKWHQPSPNVKAGDLVLIVDSNLPRFQWPMGRVESVQEGRQGLVRSCIVKRPDGSLVKRPISKVCMLEAAL